MIYYEVQLRPGVWSPRMVPASSSAVSISVKNGREEIKVTEKIGERILRKTRHAIRVPDGITLNEATTIAALAGVADYLQTRTESP